jgi:hypothetical protein
VVVQQLVIKQGGNLYVQCSEEEVTDKAKQALNSGDTALALQLLSALAQSADQMIEQNGLAAGATETQQLSAFEQEPEDRELHDRSVVELFKRHGIVIKRALNAMARAFMSDHTINAVEPDEETVRAVFAEVRTAKLRIEFLSRLLTICVNRGYGSEEHKDLIIHILKTKTYKTKDGPRYRDDSPVSSVFHSVKDRAIGLAKCKV